MTLQVYRIYSLAPLSRLRKTSNPDPEASKRAGTAGAKGVAGSYADRAFELRVRKRVMASR
jgi:hypothetical protein